MGTRSGAYHRDRDALIEWQTAPSFGNLGSTVGAGDDQPVTRTQPGEMFSQAGASVGGVYDLDYRYDDRGGAEFFQ